MTSLEKQVGTIDLLFGRTLELISLYKDNDVPLPFGLKGNLGEFIVHKELLQRFPNNKVKFEGGSFPGVDLFLDHQRIQVKTQIKHSPVTFKNGSYDSEGCPTIKRATLDDPRTDFIVLVILYVDEGFFCIEKKNIYVFDKTDFKYFSNKFCWSGTSKGDYTIVNILNVNGTPPAKLRQNIDHYNTPEYKQLFELSKDNWAKLE